MIDFPDTESRLLSQIKSHDDQRAWEQFVTLYRPLIVRMALKRGMQVADAEDLSQHVLASVANSIHRWKKQDAQFRNWLSRVVRNAIINALSRQPRDMATGRTTTHNVLLSQMDQADESQEIRQEYRRQLFLRAASIVQRQVDRDTWRAFQLTVVEANSVENAARELGKSVGSIYSSRSRVMRRLREEIQKLESGS